MTKPSEAQSAFPHAAHEEAKSMSDGYVAKYTVTASDGMSLWDWYAAHAPVSTDMLENVSSIAIEKGHGIRDSIKEGCTAVAGIAAQYADAMLAEREKREKGAP